jgi:CBS domain-containing protein
MKVRQAMMRDLCIVRPDQTIENAARIMSDFDVGMLPVVEGDKLVGVITPRDMAVRATSRGKGPDALVRDIMSPEVFYCFEDEDTAYAARSMAHQQIRRVPVVNRDRRLVGVLSLGDLAPQCCQSGESTVGGHSQDQRRA